MPGAFIVPIKFKVSDEDLAKMQSDVDKKYGSGIFKLTSEAEKKVDTIKKKIEQTGKAAQQAARNTFKTMGREAQTFSKTPQGKFVSGLVGMIGVSGATRLYNTVSTAGGRYTQSVNEKTTIGAIQGAAMGAMAGMVAGPIGAAVGAAVGGAVGALNSYIEANTEALRKATGAYEKAWNEQEKAMSRASTISDMTTFTGGDLKKATALYEVLTGKGVKNLDTILSNLSREANTEDGKYQGKNELDILNTMLVNALKSGDMRELRRTGFRGTMGSTLFGASKAGSTDVLRDLQDAYAGDIAKSAENVRKVAGINNFNEQEQAKERARQFNVTAGLMSKDAVSENIKAQKTDFKTTEKALQQQFNLAKAHLDNLEVASQNFTQEINDINKQQDDISKRGHGRQVFEGLMKETGGDFKKIRKLAKDRHGWSDSFWDWAPDDEDEDEFERLLKLAEKQQASDSVARQAAVSGGR